MFLLFMGLSLQTPRHNQIPWFSKTLDFNSWFSWSQISTRPAGGLGSRVSKHLELKCEVCAVCVKCSTENNKQKTHDLITQTLKFLNTCKTSKFQSK